MDGQALCLPPQADRLGHPSNSLDTVTANQQGGQKGRQKQSSCTEADRQTDLNLDTQIVILKDRQRQAERVPNMPPTSPTDQDNYPLCYVPRQQDHVPADAAQHGLDPLLVSSTATTATQLAHLRQHSTRVATCTYQKMWSYTYRKRV